MLISENESERSFNTKVVMAHESNIYLLGMANDSSVKNTQ